MQMIQRVQSIYLLLFIAINIVLLSGVTILQFNGSGEKIDNEINFNIAASQLNMKGKLNLHAHELDIFEEEVKAQQFSFNKTNQELTWSKWSPLILAQAILLILAIFTLFGYKNLKRQLRLARFTFFLSFVYVALIMFLAYFTLGFIKPYINELPLEDFTVERQLKLGFYLACALFPLAFLAQLGIKRDRNLIKSLDRLR